MRRIGVIEIGSRGVRLLVGEVVGREFVPVARRYDSSVRLAEALDIRGNKLRSTVEGVRQVVNGYMEVCRMMDASNVKIFGTEAVRRLSNLSQADFQLLTAETPSFKVLQPKEEAFYSLVAGIRSLPNVVNVGGTALMIDEGAGSVELAVGKLEGEQVQMKAHKSIPLGTQILASRLKNYEGHWDGLKEWVADKVGKTAIRGGVKAKHTIVLGSAATKLAWIKVRNQEDQRYDPRWVHGECLTKRLVDQFIAASTQKASRMREVIDPRDPESGEFETVLVGLVMLGVLLERLRKEVFVVCAEALRYGIAWEIGAADSEAISM